MSAPQPAPQPASVPLSSDVQQDQTAAPERLKDIPPAQFLRELDDFLAQPSVAQPIAPELFRGFWLKWGLVTTRYKPDGEEMRFTYANRIAADALAKGEYPFPPGAALAKIGAKAVHDPGFNSSLIPGPIARVQVMLKKPGDPNARDGWVYALYTPKYRGALTGDEINACHACHLMVPERDMVFSQPFPVAFGATLAHLAAETPLADKFRPTALADLPQPVRDALQKQQPVPQDVMLLTMPAFSGTIFEAREILLRLTRASKQPHILSAPDGAVFLINLPEPTGDCITAINTVSPPPDLAPSQRPLAKPGPIVTTMRRYCDKS